MDDKPFEQDASAELHVTAEDLKAEMVDYVLSLAGFAGVAEETEREERKRRSKQFSQAVKMVDEIYDEVFGEGAMRVYESFVG